MFAEFLCAAGGELDELSRGGVRLLVEFVESAFAFAAGLEHAGVLKLAQVSGNTGLPEAGDFLEFVDGEFVALQEGNDADPSGIGEGAKGFEGARHFRDGK
jgi:hypothetical protein